MQLHVPMAVPNFASQHELNYVASASGNCKQNAKLCQDVFCFVKHSVFTLGNALVALRARVPVHVDTVVPYFFFFYLMCVFLFIIIITIVFFL